MNPAEIPSSEELALTYLDQLPFPPYPFQEEAILSWFDSDGGLLVCAPTGMGKTVIAEAGLYEALKTGKRAYYTTPLIALTEQKYREIQALAERWGYSRYDVGLVTGHRRENPDAKILVVVAEILFNRLLGSEIFHPQTDREQADKDASKNSSENAAAVPFSSVLGDRSAVPFNFDDVSVVVMDEFHQFSDPERGIVWEFTLGLLPPTIRTLLISATVGNSYEFVSWLRNTALRKLSLVQSTERKVPLTYEWVGDQLLPEFLESIHSGSDEERKIPALVFCFNRDQCWDTAEVIKGRNIIDAARQREIAEELEKFDWTKGAGPKIRQLLLRGVGIHHAGILPNYRRIVEDLFQRKLLSMVVCTETLAAGINLPARSVILPTLMKGPPGDKKLIDSSSAHQIFGRAGRPQFDDRGFVFVLAHPDDVKIARFREKYDQIPEDTKDPKLREAKKKLKKKMPTRNPNEQYWTEPQFQKLRDSSPGSLTSRGPLPWRLLAHMIQSNPDLTPIRKLAARRLMGAKRLAASGKQLDDMLLTLWRGGFIRLEPNPNDFDIAGPTPEELAQKGSLYFALQNPGKREKTAEEKEAEAVAFRFKEKERERKSKGFGAGLFDEDDSADDWDFDEDLEQEEKASKNKSAAKTDETSSDASNNEKPASVGLFSSLGSLLQEEKKSESREEKSQAASAQDNPSLNGLLGQTPPPENVIYKAESAYPTEALPLLTQIKGVNPLYGVFLLSQLGKADRAERLQAFESLLEMPGNVARLVRVPPQTELPPGPLARERLDAQLLDLGLASIDELVPKTEEEKEREREERRRFGGFAEERVFLLTFADKLRRLFDYEFPLVPVKTVPVWAAGEILMNFHGNFNKYILAHQLQKQEGMIFRHLLRLILLLNEFIPLVPPETTKEEWERDLTEITNDLIACCEAVDPTETKTTLLQTAAGLEDK